jgi:hypothetical protein
MNTTATYYRTAKGSHRHLSFECANQLRAIRSGTPTVIPAAEVTDWAACEHCCDTAEVVASVKAAAARQDDMCTNSGVLNPRCVQSECRDCGKRGSVNRSTGSLRAHKPAAANTISPKIAALIAAAKN